MLNESVEKRILAALNHEEHDRVPIWDYIDNRSVLEHFAGGEKDLDKSMVKVYHGLGIDLCRGWGQAYGKDQEGLSGDHGEWQIAGLSWWRTDYPIKTVEDLKNFEFPKPDTQWIKDNIIPRQRALKEMLEPWTMWVPGFGCGFHGVYGLMGQEAFSYFIYDAPEEIDRLLEAHLEYSLAHIHAICSENLCPMFFIGDDVACKGRLLFSPAYLRRTFIRMLKACCDAVHSYGQKVIFHSDGYLMELLDDLVEAGIDGLNPIEPIAGMDIGEIKRQYGDRLVLVGNVDCSQVLPLGTVQDVVEATKRCIRDASEGGGHFIGSSSEIVPSTPLENVLAFYDACREYGRYDR